MTEKFCVVCKGNPKVTIFCPGKLIRMVECCFKAELKLVFMEEVKKMKMIKSVGFVLLLVVLLQQGVSYAACGQSGSKSCKTNFSPAKKHAAAKA